PISCGLGTIQVAHSVNVDVVLTPTASAGGTAVGFQVSSSTPDNVPGNNSKSFNTTTPDYTMVATNSPILTFPSKSISLHGSMTALNGYSSSVALSCTGVSAPSCVPQSPTPS